MVTVKLRGYCGNQIFQIFTCIAYAIKHGLEYHIPSVSTPANAFPTYFNLENKNYDSSLPEIIVEEKHFHYLELSYSDEWRDKNIVLSGYFQSFKYFELQREYLLNVLPFCVTFYDAESCSIHYRAGDYKKYPKNHPIVTKEYLYKAIKIMIGFGINNFIFHSDEIEYCEKFVKEMADRIDFKSEVRFDFLKNKSQVQELEIISKCGHNICANSSFSLITSWLNKNPNKIVVQPRKWFGEDYSDKNTKDLYYEKAILL